MLNKMQYLAISVLWLLWSQVAYALDGTSFVTKWRTHYSPDLIYIPINPDYSYNANIDCDNDGIFERTGVTTQEDMVCTYASAGEHIIAISGDFPALDMRFAAFELTGATFAVNYHSAKNQLLGVMQWGNIQWRDLAYSFLGTSDELEISASEPPNLSQVTNLSGLFSTMKDIKQDITAWDVSTITNMTGMFSGAVNFNQDISGWDVSNVTNMTGMFRATAFNQDISSWDVSNVTDMSEMFSKSVFNRDISAWDVSNVTDMSGMFSYTEQFNQNISNWDVSSVSDFSEMFTNANAFNQNLNMWNTSQASNMSRMFENTTQFNGNISNWDVSSVVDMSRLFRNAKAFNQDIGRWDVSHVNNMRLMFEGASLFNQNLSSWNISQVTDMSSMLGGTKLSTAHYDALLQAWSQLPPQPNLVFDAGLAQYSANSAAETARARLINEYGWTIDDGGYSDEVIDMLECGQVANGRQNITISTACHNDDWLFDVHITETGHITGGKLSGMIQNDGIVQDIQLVGGTLEGGILVGYINNTDTMGGNSNALSNEQSSNKAGNIVKNATFAAGSVLEGGILSGYIVSDLFNPVVLKGNPLFEDVYLNYVILDQTGYSYETEYFGQGVHHIQDSSWQYLCDDEVSSLSQNTLSNVCFAQRKTVNQTQDVLRIFPAPEHLGQSVEIVFLAVDDIYTYSYDGKFWQGNAEGVENIINAKTISVLPYLLDVTLPNLDLFTVVFAGYRLSDGDVIYIRVK